MVGLPLILASAMKILDWSECFKHIVLVHQLGFAIAAISIVWEQLQEW